MHSVFVLQEVWWATAATAPDKVREYQHRKPSLGALYFFSVLKLSSSLLQGGYEELFKGKGRSNCAHTSRKGRPKVIWQRKKVPIQLKRHCLELISVCVCVCETDLHLCCVCPLGFSVLHPVCICWAVVGKRSWRRWRRRDARSRKPSRVHLLELVTVSRRCSSSIWRGRCVNDDNIRHCSHPM